MPESFYLSIRDDIKSNNIVLFAVQEQDHFVEPKRSYMQRILVESETAAYYYRSGLAQV